MRYFVIEIGCMECASPGDEMAELMLQTDDLTEAKACADTFPYPGEATRILLDTVEGKILQSPK